jgi:hypothetical protein
MTTSLFHGSARYEMRVVESYGQASGFLPPQDRACLLPNKPVAVAVPLFLRDLPKAVPRWVETVRLYREILFEITPGMPFGIIPESRLSWPGFPRHFQKTLDRRIRDCGGAIVRKIRIEATRAI